MPLQMPVTQIIAEYWCTPKEKLYNPGGNNKPEDSLSHVHRKLSSCFRHFRYAPNPTISYSQKPARHVFPLRLLHGWHPVLMLYNRTDRHVVSPDSDTPELHLFYSAHWPLLQGITTSLHNDIQASYHSYFLIKHANGNTSLYKDMAHH